MNSSLSWKATLTSLLLSRKCTCNFPASIETLEDHPYTRAIYGKPKAREIPSYIRTRDAFEEPFDPENTRHKAYLYISYINGLIPEFEPGMDVEVFCQSDGVNAINGATSELVLHMAFQGKFIGLVAQEIIHIPFAALETHVRWLPDITTRQKLVYATRFFENAIQFGGMPVIVKCATVDTPLFDRIASYGILEKAGCLSGYNQDGTTQDLFMYQTPVIRV